MGRPLTFDVGDVVAAGLALVAGAGWDAVSVRSVAEQLGVSPMAIYRVVDDAEQLRRAIADAAARDLQPVARDGAHVIGALRAWAPRAYERLGRYPGLANFVIAEWTELPRWLDIVEAFLARADAEGYSVEDAVDTVNAVFAYVLVRTQLRDRARTLPRRSLAPVRADRGRYPRLVAGI